MPAYCGDPAATMPSECRASAYVGPNSPRVAGVHGPKDSHTAPDHRPIRINGASPVRVKAPAPWSEPACTAPVWAAALNPAPTFDHDVPFHRATQLAATDGLPALVKLPNR